MCEVVLSALESFGRDFPFGFWPTTVVGLFNDFLLARQVCKDFSNPIPEFFGERSTSSISIKDIAVHLCLAFHVDTFNVG